MSYWILTDTGHVTPSTTVQRLTKSEINTTDNKRRLRNYESKVEEIIDITNMDLLEPNLLTECNRLSMDEGYQQFQD